jgi:5'-3' exonuclease
MGIEGLFSTLKKKGLAPMPVDLSQFKDTRIEVDLFGSYFARILTLMTDDYGTDKASEVGMKLAAFLKADFTPANCRIHIDGGKSAQKHKEHEARLARRKKTSEQLDKNIEKMKTNSLQGKWTAHSVMERIKKDLRQIFQLTATDKDLLQKAFELNHFEVCRCPAEADICISRTLRSASSPTASTSAASSRASQPTTNSVVVSGDSDMVVHQDVATVLRPIPRSAGYALYTKEAVTRTLELPDPLYLTALGIVCKNDYSRNIHGLGIIRNIELLQKTSCDLDVSKIVDEYVALASEATGEDVDSSHFDTAKLVFIELREDVLEEKDLDNYFTKAYPEVKKNKNLRFQVASVMHGKRR